MAITHHTELEIYKKAFDTAMEIFRLSKHFPVEERYSLTDQIRRSSRSVCANLAEAWRNKQGKRRSRGSGGGICLSIDKMNVTPFINKVSSPPASSSPSAPPALL